MARSPPISAEELFEACEDGDLPLVRRLLKKVRPGDGILENVDWPSLIIASRTGHAEIVKALIKAGASLDLVADSDYWDYELTSLGAACYNGHLDIVETLLDANADSSIDDGSALVAACIRGNTEIVKVLLKRGVDCNIRDGFSLCVACEESYLSIIELLLEHGAETNQAGNWHPLPCAARSGNLTTVTMLLDKGADIRAVDRDHGPALHAACRGKNEEIVVKLLAHGADAHQTDPDGRSALHIAAADSTVQIIRRLIDHGADINAIDDNDDTPLIHACLFSDNSFAKVELLLEQGAVVDACGRFGTALTMSCWRGNADVCKLLLQWKADVTIEGGEFGTALHAACHKEHYELLPPLLEKGADPYSEVGFYGSAITIARHKNRPDIVDLLQRLSKHPHPRHMNSYDLLPSFHTAFPHPVDRSLPYRPATCLQISLDLQSDVL
jgi:ankyrin repeat protein